MSNEIVYVCNSTNNKNIRENELKILRKAEDQYYFEFGENEMNLKKRYYNSLEELEKDYKEVEKIKKKIEKVALNIKTTEDTKEEENAPYQKQDASVRLTEREERREDRDRRYRRRNIF